MLQVLVDVVLAQRVLDVVGLLVVLPVLVQLMDLTSHISLFLSVKTLKIEHFQLTHSLVITKYL